MGNPKHGDRVMIVASSAELGKSDILGNLADDLAEFVRRSVQDASSLDEVERGTLQRLLAMGHAALPPLADRFSHAVTNPSHDPCEPFSANTPSTPSFIPRDPN
jgi:hypothetical protein